MGPNYFRSDLFTTVTIYHSTFMRGTQNLPTDPEQSWLFSKEYED